MSQYTTEMIEDIKARYAECPTLDTVAQLAKLYNKPERSIISKLSALGVYKRKVYVSKNGELPIKKEEYIERISKLLDIDATLLESLEKVTKYALALMEKRIQEMKAKEEYNGKDQT